MERKIYWGTAIIAVLIGFATFFIPDAPSDANLLPWNIQHPTAGSSRIFGLTLKQSNINEAEQLFKEQAKIGLFKSPQGKLAAEAFFDEVTLSNLKAKIAVRVDIPEADKQAMFDRGLRMYGVDSGKQITLTPDDIAQVRKLPISGLTYMPSVKLDEETLTRRFGPPTMRIKESESGAVHLLYAQHGLDITLGGSEKPVLQYVTPADFPALTTPLIAAGKLLK